MRKKRTKNNYFTKVHEDAIVRYALSSSRQEKSKLYMTLIQPAFDEMVNKIMLMVLSAVAEIEHGGIKKKFAEGKLHWAEKGYAVGGSAPYGYVKEEVKFKEGKRLKSRMKLVPVPEEMKILDFIDKLRAKGLGPTRIARQIKEHFPGKEMPEWKVRRILERRVQGLHKE